MHQSHIPQCTRLHISVTKHRIVGYVTDALWDLWDGSIVAHFFLASNWWFSSRIYTFNPLTTYQSPRAVDPRFNVVQYGVTLDTENMYPFFEQQQIYTKKIYFCYENYVEILAVHF